MALRFLPNSISLAPFPPADRRCSSTKMNCDRLLITVENHFYIEGRGLIVVPHLDLPSPSNRCTPFSDEVLVQRPDGSTERLEVRFLIEHISLIEGGSKWNIVAMIPLGTNETIPVGSRLFVSAETLMRVRGND